jgi:hypothetical protein
MTIKKKKLCFVIMPFSKTVSHSEKEWTETFENIFSPAIIASRLGYECERSKIRTGAFIKDILTKLNQADVVLADLTDMNPNVFYELGVRHTLSNRTILVSEKMDFAPSDLKPYGVIIYDKTPSGVTKFKKEISKILRDIRDDPDRADNPVSDYLKLKSILTDPYETKIIIKKLTALISECSFNLTVTERVLRAAKMEKVATVRFGKSAIDLLTSTYYIYPNKDCIRFAIDLLRLYSTLNARLDLLNATGYEKAVTKSLLEDMPVAREAIERFMKMSSKILKDFRNQNLSEPSELSICVARESHKKYLDIE